MIVIQANTDTEFEVEFFGCVIDKSDDLRVVDCDNHFCEFIGVHPSKVKGKLFLYDILVPQEREDIVQKLCKKNSPYVYLDLYIKDKTGSYNFVNCYARNNEENTLCQLTFADVSRSIAKSKKIKEKAKTINRLIDLVNGGVCLFKVLSDMRFQVLFANEACCRYFGTNKESARAKIYRLDDIIHPDDKSACYQAIGKAMATKCPIDMEIRIMTHKDEYIWCKWNSDIQKYDKDNCPVFHAIFTDISGVKRAEQEAAKQREMLVKMFKNMPGPVFGTSYDDPFKLSVVSEDFIKMIGYTRSELFEKYEGDLSKLILPNEIAVARHRLDFDNTQSKAINATYSIRTKAGNYLVVVDRRKVIELESGEKSLIGMLSDITSARLDGYMDL
ncbi:MAG: PAS domain-containing protein [Eubacterium sp.]